MNVTIYWSHDGKRRGAMQVYNTAPNIDPADIKKPENYKVCWGYGEKWGCCGLAVEKYDFDKDTVWLDEYDDDGDQVYIESDGIVVDNGWGVDQLLAPLKTSSLKEYMEWVDDNIDIVAVDGSVFFRSSRLESK